MNNATIKYFHQELIKLINSCGLTVGTAYFVVRDVLHDLEKSYLDCAYRETQAENKTTETHTFIVTDPQENTIEQKEINENGESNTDASTDFGSINDD